MECAKSEFINICKSRMARYGVFSCFLFLLILWVVYLTFPKMPPLVNALIRFALFLFISAEYFYRSEGKEIIPKKEVAALALVLGTLIVVWKEHLMIGWMSAYSIAQLFLSVGALMLLGVILDYPQTKYRATRAQNPSYIKENNKDKKYYEKFGDRRTIGNIIFGIAFAIFLTCLLWIALGGNSRDAYMQFFLLEMNIPQDETLSDVLITNATIVDSKIINVTIIDAKLINTTVIETT